MLRLIIGRAGTGKTAAVIGEIARAVAEGRGGSMLIVPEQYSHEAERELCERCGDALSLYAEVFSFTGLARRVLQQQGGLAADWLDKGGRLLCMALALDQISSRLRLYGGAARRAELQSALLAAVDECKSAAVDAPALAAASALAEGELADKLADLSLVLEAYDAVVARGHADPTERLDLLADKLGGSGIGKTSRVYLDGFIDFTRQEQRVIRALLETGAEVTVCLTLDDLHGDDEVFALSRTAAGRLCALAEELGCAVQIERMDGRGDKGGALDFFTDNLFSYSPARWEGETDAIRLCAAPGLTAECELAAATAISLVRDRGCRWRDIAVAVRGFEDYRRTLQSVFAHYGVPLYTARKSELLSKSIPALISAAYAIVCGGWEQDDVSDYMRSALTGLSIDECDELETYVFKWRLRARAWEREGDWRQHPDGYNADFDEQTEQRLARINALRRRLAGPLQRFERSARLAHTAAGQAAALSSLLLELELPRRLEERAAVLSAAGRDSLAAESAQLWEITVGALEQCAAVLGDTAMETEEFGRLFTRMLSCYDVGTIPLSLDAVSAGDFDRMRRRHIRHLIVLGAQDERLPAAEEGGGVFSEDERERLLSLGIDLGGAGADELWREFSLIYNCVSLPSESLTLSYSLLGPKGEEQRPSFLISRASSLFGLRAERVDLTEVRASAPNSALGLASRPETDARCRAARDYFAAREPRRLEALRRAAEMRRGRLSAEAVGALYGSRLRLSASQIDKLADCKYAYFCRYGLRARPYEPADFKPNDVGTFFHAVFENTARQVKARGGFAAVPDDELRGIVDTVIERHIAEELDGFAEKTERFRHLFNRLRAEVWQIVQDMADELRRSDFEPLDFELNFGKSDTMPPVLLGEGGRSMQLIGVADRVDGYLHDGRLYLRVVDYKTGSKSFSLSDVWYGMGLQMLLYLFALSEHGEERYGHPVEPAGVMYVPARSVMVSVEAEDDETRRSKAIAKSLRRSGLVLNEPPELLQAWERGDEQLYIPLTIGRGGKPTDESFADAERMGLLYRHIRRTLGRMTDELRSGAIDADPYVKSDSKSPCDVCDYADACRFVDGQAGEKSRYLAKLSTAEVWERMRGDEES